MAQRFIYRLSFLTIIFTFFFLQACKKKEAQLPTMFELLESKQTGLDFTNKLTATDSFNMFKYMYFYNGAGVGAGDFNNDGKIDLFFASNQGQNKLYLNQGGLKFKDVTTDAKIPFDGGWNTGVSVIDINNDGLLDIYICKVGKFETLHGKNELLICQGIDKNGVPFYKDEAKEYGLDFSGFSTQAAFFDYDGDGDLDMFLLNHSVHQNGNFAPRKNFLGTYNELTGDRIYRNDNGHFTDVTKQTGINSSAIGYGLGICVADINLDGWPDIYIGNDFHENDYLYINQKNGTFKEVLNDKMMHTSQFSMGVDVADINNDGYPEVISMDMLPSDPYILKRSLGEDNYDLFYEKLGYGYNYQYTRNNLQINMRNGMFCEAGLYAGVAATDWSWAPLWVDFDNDGLKDLFISNGIPKRLNDIDYVNFVTNDEVQHQIKANKVDEKEMTILDKFPQIKLPNKFFSNKGDIQFQDVASQIKNDKSTYSNGAVYADFDNDGDIDVVVNNIDDPAMLYQNKSNDNKDKPFMDIILKGTAKNINAIGAKLVMFANGGIRTYEKFPVKGFLSSMETPMHIGLDHTKTDSLFLVWPDNTYQKITPKTNTTITVNYRTGLPKFNYAIITNHRKNSTKPMEDITPQTGLNYLHKENFFHEFDREPLMPHMLSREGPALAVADVNHDGLEDVFIGASRNEKPALFLQQPNGRFVKSNQPALDLDSALEDVSACFVDVNNDKNLDLVVASGGNEFYGEDEHNTPRVYLNDGHGNFTKKANAFDALYLTASCVVPCDFDGDGNMDLFIGGRVVPWAYGQTPTSYLLKNDGTGHFKDVTAQYAESLASIGFVTNAVWCDLDNDGKKDLIVSLEWGGICAFMNHNGKFEKKQLADKKGWWNFILPVDLNNDGHIDFVCGNLGLNSRLKASEKEPVKLYYNDFDDNGKKEQVLTYFLQGREIPFANFAELEKQIPLLKKKFLYAGDFAKSTLEELFTKDKLNNSTVWSADYFSSAVLMNDGKNNFTVQALPWQAQLSSLRDAQIIDANGDNLPDVLLVGNFYENNIEMGRNDGDFGTILINKGNGKFECESINGLQIKGQVRHINKINIAGKASFILARNNDSLMVITNKKSNH